MSVSPLRVPCHHNSAEGPNLEDRRVDISKLVSTQASSVPEALAVVHKEDRLTYRELDARAKYLAQHLLKLGVGPNVVVGLCLPRSIGMIVGALGILHSGAAYLPLDPSYPTARIAFELNDAQVSVVVADDCLAARLSEGRVVVPLDSAGRQTNAHNNGQGPELSRTEVHGKDLAYVIYTSGSTGEPKGIDITHASLENLVSWHQQAFAVTPSDRATQQASPGFDAAIWEVWPYLTAGASIHIPDDDTRTDPERLRDWLVKHKITKTFVPTPMAERLMTLQWPPDTALRILLTGADALRHYPPASLPFIVVNNYGPTECTVVATSGTVQPNGTPDWLPPIGRPIANTEVYILDEKLQPVAPGRAGELHIAGAGLSCGYRNRPELTRERFVPNPFTTESGSRLYRTGDMACFLPDGQIAFLGRSDDQVKIRGYRIETNEIASVLDRHPMVQGSVVVAREDNPGEKRLLAYIVPRGNGQLTDKLLREFLLLTLPEYMIPAGFFRIDSIPLSASGKIDRNALPSPTKAIPFSENKYSAPRTPVEARMAAILSTLLRVENVGANENFFLLGGNSLLGAQVIARVRDTFGVEMTLLALFDNPTVSGLSAEVERLLVARLGEMSEDEAERLVGELNPRNKL